MQFSNDMYDNTSDYYTAVDMNAFYENNYMPAMDPSTSLYSTFSLTASPSAPNFEQFPFLPTPSNSPGPAHASGSTSVPYPHVAYPSPTYYDASMNVNLWGLPMGCATPPRQPTISLPAIAGLQTPCATPSPAHRSETSLSMSMPRTGMMTPSKPQQKRLRHQSRSKKNSTARHLKASTKAAIRTRPLGHKTTYRVTRTDQMRLEGVYGSDWVAANSRAFTVEYTFPSEEEFECQFLGCSKKYTGTTEAISEHILTYHQNDGENGFYELQKNMRKTAAELVEFCLGKCVAQAVRCYFCNVHMSRDFSYGRHLRTCSQLRDAVIEKYMGDETKKKKEQGSKVVKASKVRRAKKKSDKSVVSALPSPGPSPQPQSRVLPLPDLSPFNPAASHFYAGPVTVAALPSPALSPPRAAQHVALDLLSTMADQNAPTTPPYVNMYAMVPFDAIPTHDEERYPAVNDEETVMHDLGFPMSLNAEIGSLTQWQQDGGFFSTWLSEL